MSALREAAQQALEALESTHLFAAHEHYPRRRVADALDALKAALTQQEQEPVAWVDEAYIAWLAEHPGGIVTTRLVSQKSPERQMPIYTHPPRREWQSLTDTDIARVFRVVYGGVRFGPSEKEFAIAVEAALKEKNVNG